MDIYRSTLDLNRPEARDSTFRNKVRKDLSQAKWLLDIHSFPLGYFHNFDLTILDNATHFDPITSRSLGTAYGRNLFLFLDQCGLSVGYFIIITVRLLKANSKFVVKFIFSF